MTLFFKIFALHKNVKLPVWKLSGHSLELFIRIKITLPVFQSLESKSFNQEAAYCSLTISTWFLFLD